MRIAHVSDCYLPRLGGIETQVHDLAVRQSADGHDVEVVTLVGSSGDRVDDVVTHRAPARLRTDNATHLSATRRGVRQALNGGYDVVHVHLSIFSPLALGVLLEAGRSGIPVAATVHSLWGNFEAALAATGPVMRWRSRPVAWSAVSSVAALPLQQRLGLRVSVVPNGVDVDWWAQADRRSPASQLRVLTVMRLTRRKRPLPLMRMITDAARHGQGSPLGLTIVGDGPQANEARRRARGSPASIDLVGPLTRPQIRSLAGVHDVYVSPAPLESFGIAALEARSAGLPVLGRRGSGVGDFIRDGTDGLLVDSDRQLSDAIAALAGDSAWLARLQHGAAGQPPFGWSATLAGYDDLYQRAFALTGRPTVVRR